MNDQLLHIVSFNVPWPADYGGIIDVFYKIRALHKAGVRIILHCYQYGREQAEELEQYCYRIHYYLRSTGIEYYFQNKPYIVATRNSLSLCRNLLEDEYPVLFEGLHTTYPMLYGLQPGRILMVRAHNIEHEYYLGLANQEKQFFKQIYYYSESLKLKHYEEILRQTSIILPISAGDLTWFGKYGKAIHLPAFHPFDEVSIKTGTGKYILYHGNLSVGENRMAVEFLLKEVFPGISFPIVIAGKDPGQGIIRLAAQNPNIRLIENPSAEEMEYLLSDAQENILPTFQPTGLKLKLLYALFRGRHCLVNTAMVNNSGLEECCVIRDRAEEMKQEIHLLMQSPFTGEAIEQRKSLLMSKYSNYLNARILVDLN
jgi:hypothetical protein